MILKRHTTLSANVVGFCRYLRSEGFAIAAPEEADALQILSILSPFSSPESLNLALKTCLARTPTQVERFDELANYYWQQVEKAVDSKVTDQEKAQQNRAQPSPQAQFQNLKDWLYGKNKSEEEAEIHTFSRVETLGKKDFSLLTAEEAKELYDVIQQIARRLARQQNRRYRTADTGRLDVRQTLRQNLRRGGEILELRRQKKRQERLELVLLCDVSRSMELYSRFVVQFAFAFQQVFRRIETFVFSTKLSKVSEILRGGDFYKNLENLSESVPHWSGGTRIGASLQQFVDEFGDKHLTSRTVIIILSDGWDTDDAAVLTAAMQKIHQKANRVIWLNPLAGQPNFQPSTAAMTAAMPFIDVFAAAHNAEALRGLGRVL
jgi:uncharacterized protein